MALEMAYINGVGELGTDGFYALHMSPEDREKLLQMLRDAHAQYYDSESGHDMEKLQDAKRFIEELEVPDDRADNSLKSGDSTE